MLARPGLPSRHKALQRCLKTIVLTVHDSVARGSQCQNKSVCLSRDNINAAVCGERIIGVGCQPTKPAE